MREEIAHFRARREVIRRVVEFEDFTRCWHEDELPARGLVTRVQQIVERKDSFTRMRLEAEKERRQRLEIEAARDREHRQRLGQNQSGAERPLRVVLGE